MSEYQLILGDCLEIVGTLNDNSIDAIVTDPPAGISFMGKDWDHNKGGRDQWIVWMTSIATECLRVLKPGGHALVWAIPRTSHWTATAWENAGFEVRDMIAHVFGTGFPKSLNISKAIDREAGAEREVVGIKSYAEGQTHRDTQDRNQSGRYNFTMREGTDPERLKTIASTLAAKQWDGWGTALKPAMENWILLRKPISEKTVAANVIKWRTGAINIDGCRVGANDKSKFPSGTISKTENTFGNGVGMYADNQRTEDTNPSGRFPANLIHDGSEEVTSLFPMTTSTANVRHNGEFKSVAKGAETARDSFGFNDAGSASRFFYCAKASSTDRNEGSEQIRERIRSDARPNSPDLTGKFPDHDGRARSGNFHPTVKSVSLMRYLCRLITPPNGIILDPFMGSGSTGKAAMLEGFTFVGCEREPEYFRIAECRIDFALNGPLNNLEVPKTAFRQLDLMQFPIPETGE